MDLTSLISSCLKSDRAAQYKLYDAYKDNLYTIIYRLTGDKAMSSDLLQETFIAAFKNLANLNEPLYFHSWIKQIAVRKTYRVLKNKKINVPVEDYHLGTEQAVDIGYIEQAISSLPAKSRTVFVMCEVEGFSHKEIAEAMNISVGTSKSQLNYAKTKLKDILRPHLYNE